MSDVHNHELRPHPEQVDPEDSYFGSPESVPVITNKLADAHAFDYFDKVLHESTLEHDGTHLWEWMTGFSEDELSTLAVFATHALHSRNPSFAKTTLRTMLDALTNPEHSAVWEALSQALTASHERPF